MGSPRGSAVKVSMCSAGDAGDQGSIPSCEDPLEKEMATHLSILAWKIPRTEEPSRLQSTGLPRVRHDLATEPSLPPIEIISLNMFLKKSNINYKAQIVFDSLPHLIVIPCICLEWCGGHLLLLILKRVPLDVFWSITFDTLVCFTLMLFMFPDNYIYCIMLNVLFLYLSHPRGYKLWHRLCPIYLSLTRTQHWGRHTKAVFL